jgi:hypothetical protein
MIDMQHKIPIHLDKPDKFVLGMTGRQTVIVALGLALGYMAFGAFDYTDNLFLLIPAILCFALILLLAVIVAFVKYKHKDLEQWALIAFMYYASPRRYIWTAERLYVPTSEELDAEQWSPLDRKKGQTEEW